MVDVRDDGKIADVLHVPEKEKGKSRLGRNPAKRPRD
jgi:hypothetical protein